MADPIVVINASNGSDSISSGSPSTLANIYGSAASITAGSTSIDLSSDAPNLSSVPIDGSAAIWVESPSGRQFFKITGVNNVTKIVTVSTAAHVTATSRRWAIGGKRASLNSVITTDVLAGWEIRVEVATAPPPITDLTGSDLINVVRLELDDQQVSGQQPRFSDADILMALNQAQDYLCTSFQLIREEITLTTASGIRVYDISSRIVSISNVIKNDETRRLYRIEKKGMDDEYPQWRSVTGEPVSYYIEGHDSIGFYPKPNGAYTYIIDAYMLPQTEITLSGIPSIHRRHQRAIAHVAAAILAGTDTANEHRVARIPIQWERAKMFLSGVGSFKHGGGRIAGGASVVIPERLPPVVNV